MHYLVVTVCRVLGTTVVQVVLALEHHSLAFRAKSATTTRVALSPVTALFRMVELRSVLPMAPYVQDISARYKALNIYIYIFFLRGVGGGIPVARPKGKGSFLRRKTTKFWIDHPEGIACPAPSNRATIVAFCGR